MAFPHRSQGYAVVNIWLYGSERLGTEILFSVRRSWLVQQGPARGQDMHFVSASAWHNCRQILISNTRLTVLKQVMTSAYANVLNGHMWLVDVVNQYTSSVPH